MIYQNTVPFSYSKLGKYPTTEMKYIDMINGSYMMKTTARGGDSWFYERSFAHIYGTEYLIATASWPDMNMDNLKLINVNIKPGLRIPQPDVIFGTPSVDTGIRSIGISKNHKYMALSCPAGIGIVNLHSMKFEYINYNITSTYNNRSVDTNDDASKIYVIDKDVDSRVQCIDTTSNVVLWESNVVAKGSHIFHDTDTDVTWVVTEDRVIGKIEGNGIFTAVGDAGYSLYSGTYNVRPPGGRYISWGGTSPSKFFDIQTETLKTFHNFSSYGFAPRWVGEHTYLESTNSSAALVHIKDYDNETYDYYPLASNIGDTNMWYYETLFGEYGKYEATVDITDSAGEEFFFVEATVGSEIVGRTFINSPTTSISIRVCTIEPVKVTVSSIKRHLRKPGATYAVGNEIVTLDTEYVYECTTAGTTSTIQIPYPTTGSVTDGTAVFLTKHKIANTVEYPHVVPTALY